MSREEREGGAGEERRGQDPSWLEVGLLKGRGGAVQRCSAACCLSFCGVYYNMMAASYPAHSMTHVTMALFKCLASSIPLSSRLLLW